ncbi:MAG: cysteine hydrolase [Clostridiales bacterium]|nr:cysteine hydrolase [Clostridiales bacterium]
MKILIVVDMQNDFVTGSLGTKEAVEVVPNVKKKIEEYLKNRDRIIFTKDTHQSNYLDTQEGRNLPVEHCIIYSHGWEIIPELKLYAKEVFSKRTFGSVELAKELLESDYDEIEIVGLCTDICVVSNALLLKAFAPELKITVDASCCAGVRPETHKAALETMKMCQINVIAE